MWNKQPYSNRLLLPLLLFATAGLLSSCRSTAPQLDYRELAQASIRLGVDIELTDNHKLYIEASKWIGTPYRYGGHSLQGTDCSGFTSLIYKKVYRRTLKRSSEEQRKYDCHSIRRKQLQEGNLVFFHNGRKSRTATHVGIYLKENKFIHASTRQGVIVSSLDEPYYRSHWLCGGIVK